MASTRFRVCPSCGAKNKPRFEYCLRCGEDLAKVAAPREPGGTAAQEDAGGGLPSVGLGLMAAALVLVGLAYAFRPHGENSPVDPGVFAVAREPSPPPASPAPVPPGYDLLLRGQRRLEVNDFDGAIEALRDAVAANPKDASYREAYARALWSRGRLAEATTELVAAVDLSPQNPGYKFELGKLYAATGNTREAIRVYEEARGLGPAPVTVLRELAIVYERAGDHAGAVRTLRPALEQQPGDPQLGTELADALAQTGDLAAAVETYRSVLAQTPGESTARGLLAELLLKEGKGDEAVAVLREGVVATSPAPVLHRALGSMLERTGKLAEAAAAYREYVRLAPNSDDASLMAGRAQKIEKALQPPQPTATKP